MYERMHDEGDSSKGIAAADMFSGVSLGPQVGRIKRLIDATGAKTVLDYGAGKGRLYEPRQVRVGERSWDSVLDFWEIDLVTLYDPAYGPHNKLPQGRFDGVLCTDVMEHCPEEDVPWIVAELFGYASRFVFVNAACYPAAKTLPNGENAHCTIRPPEWWEDIFRRAAAADAAVRWELWVEYQPPGAEREGRIERCVAGGGC
jgi:hypothetical protein